MTPPTSSSPWQRLDGAQCLRAWRSQELQAIEDVLRAVLATWEAEWGLPAAQRSPGCVPASESVAAETDWECLGAADDRSVWWDAPADLVDGLASSLWGAEISSPIARALAQACREDLASRLRSFLSLSAPGDRQAAIRPVLHRWSGAVLATTGWGVRLLLEGPVLQALLAASGQELLRTDSRPASRRPAAVSVAESLARRRVGLRVQLAACELDLGSLQDLRTGDVVRLAHAVDAPAIVADLAGQPVFGAFLARRQGRKAVELAPVGTPQ